MKKRLIGPIAGIGLLSLAFCSSAMANQETYLSGKYTLIDTSPINIIEQQINQQDVQTEVTAAGVQPLYQSFVEHYSAFMNKTTQGVVDFEFIMSAQNSQTAQQLQYLFRRAIDEKLPLDAFADFGITRDDNNHYYIDLKTHPHLALPAQLFGVIFGGSHMFLNSSALISRGFTKKDSLVLKNYMKQFDADYMEKESSHVQAALLYHRLSHLQATVASKSILDPDYYRHQFEQQNAMYFSTMNNKWRNWGLKLLSQFEPQARRILQSYLVEKLSSSIKISASENQTDRLEKNIVGKDVAQRLKTVLIEEFKEENLQ
ncbi:MAG: hypothetical protein ACI8WB_005935 [Phenylobacterium sp.]|jgi:hypothetical protein